MTLRKILLGFSVLAFAAAVTPAMADNGKSNGKGASHSTSAKGNGNSNGNGNGKSANHTDDSAEVEPSKGDLASELKGLNAVKANPNALENASPNSQVGRIAAYQDAALATKAIQEELDAANKALAALPVPERDLATIEADIALLDPAAAGYTDALAALEAERDAAIAYQDAVAALEAKTLAAETAQAAEDEALLSASGGRPLSDEAIAYIRDVLNI